VWNLDQVPLPPWTPDLQALELLASVAELGSIGRAAVQHGISQPSASARLAHLERRVGVALLLRSPTGTRLTPSGEAFVTWTRPVLESAHALVDNVQMLRTGQRARLAVGASLTIAEYLLPQWLQDLRQTEPELHVAVAVANSVEVCTEVRGGQIEVGFVESPTVPRDLSRSRIGSDRLALVVAASHRLARNAKRPLAVAELAGLPLLLREEGSGTRETFLRAVRRAGIDESALLAECSTLGSTATILASARVGAGVGVISRRAIAADVAAGSLVELTTEGLELLRPLHAVWLGSAPSPAVSTLIGIARARNRRPPVE
jgi:DNA-binding transcriptional LysR family regulator